MRACLPAVLIGLVAGSPAWAGPQQPAPSPGSGPTIERIENTFVASPDYKVSDIDGKTGHLAGFSVGYLVQELVFVGGAGYWLTSGASGWDLSYGGLVVGVRIPASDRVAFGVRGLTGLGHATLNTTLADLFQNPRWPRWPMAALPTGRGVRWGMPEMGDVATAGQTPVELSENFLVFEPQAEVTFAVTRRIRFGVSGGYRLTGGVDALSDRLNGATGTVSVQVDLK